MINSLIEIIGKNGNYPYGIEFKAHPNFVEYTYNARTHLYVVSEQRLPARQVQPTTKMKKKKKKTKNVRNIQRTKLYRSGCKVVCMNPIYVSIHEKEH